MEESHERRKVSRVRELVDAIEKIERKPGNGGKKEKDRIKDRFKDSIRVLAADSEDWERKQNGKTC